VSQYLTDVVAAGVEDGEDGVADGAFQVASGQAAISFHVANFSLDRAAPAEVYDLFGSQPSACAADQDTGLPFVMPPVTAIDDGKRGALICQDLDLAERIPQRVTVIRVARKPVMRHDPAGAALIIMLRSLKMPGMAQAVHDLHEQGSPAFEAAMPILSQLLKAEMAEREVRSTAYHMKAARFPAYKDLSAFDFAASEIREASV